MPPGKLEVVIVGFTAEADSLIVIENAFVAVPAELVALIVNENVPALLGVPEIKPLEALSDKPRLAESRSRCPMSQPCCLSR